MKYQKLQIFRPVFSNRISQDWGENRACVRPNGTIFGVDFTCPVGTQSFYQSLGMKGHSGLDIPTWIGEDVYHAATFPGWWRSEVDSRGGIGVDIVSNEPLFFTGTPPKEISVTAELVDGGYLHYVKMRYWHLSKAVGHENKQITVGSIIGLAGNTGASSGPHLHFAPKWCLKDGRGIGNDNGYYGAFDPRPFYIHRVTASEHAKFLLQETIPLSNDEIKDITNQLSVARQLLLALIKLKNKI